jgi:hypothetical protein
MQVIIFTTPEDKVAICTPTGALPIDQVKAKDTPSHSIIVDHTDLPNEYFDFHDAWEIQDGSVVINMTKAKEFTKGRLRFERQPLLDAQDVLFQRALETGADTTAIVAEKTRLRDLPKLTDSCTTLEELRALKASK